jgi:DNA-binding CsgD family transcriptional regulator
MGHTTFNIAGWQAHWRNGRSPAYGAGNDTITYAASRGLKDFVTTDTISGNTVAIARMARLSIHSRRARARLSCYCCRLLTFDAGFCPLYFFSTGKKLSKCVRECGGLWAFFKTCMSRQYLVIAPCNVPLCKTGAVLSFRCFLYFPPLSAGCLDQKQKMNVLREKFKDSLSGISVLMLYFVAYNVGLAYYQLRGVSKELYISNIVGFSCGILVMALALPFWEQRLANGRRLWRALFFLLFLLPPVYTALQLFQVGFTASLISQIFQVALWGLPHPVALWLFFRHVSPRLHAVGFGFAMGIDNLLWAILLPLFSRPGPELAAIADRLLPLLFLFRNAALLVMAILCLLLMIRSRPWCGMENGLVLPPFERGQFLLVFAVVLGGYFLNGFSGFIFSGRVTFLVGRAELMHLMLAFLFPLAGWAVSRRETVLAGILSTCVLWFALTPFLLSFADSGAFANAVYLLCDISGQMLIFGGTLVFGRFACSWRCRRPALVCCTVYLTFAVLAVGRIAALRLHDLAPELVAPALYLFAIVCACSIFALSRAFPLPLPPESPEPAADGEKKRAFAASFALSNREMEVLDGLLLGMKSEAIGATLHISERTVRLHLGNLVRKTVTRNRQDLLRRYIAWKQPE